MAELMISALHPAVGARVEGMDAASLIDDDVVARLRATFDAHGVLVFPDLEITEAQQRQLVFALIQEPLPAEGDPSMEQTLHVSNREERSAAPYGRLLFHCDNMWARTPQPAISLYGLRVVPPGAPTEFASMVHAWDTLPADLRERVIGLEARHGFEGSYPNRGGDDDVTDTDFGLSRSVVRPVAFRHPRTGKTMLYVSQQATIEVLGVTADENEALLAELFAHLYQPSAVMVHDWQERDLVVWDNIAVQHARGKVALDGPERTLRKVFGPTNLDPDELLFPNYSKVSGERR